MAQTQTSEVVSIHVQKAIVPVKKANGLEDPFEDVSGTFKAGFFTGVVTMGALLASVSWIFI